MNTKAITALTLGLAAASFACEARAQTCTEALVGDAIVVSRATGTVYSVDPVSGQIRALLTGPELRLGKTGTRGTGPSFSTAGQASLLAMGDRILAHPGGSSPDTASLFWLDPFTGARTVVPGSPNRALSSSGEMIRLSDSEVLVAADDFRGGGSTGMSSVLQYNVNTGAFTTISGRRASDGVIVGDGPLMYEARAIALLNPTTLVAAEFGFDFPKAGVFLIDLNTGNRTFLSRMGRTPVVRDNYVNGVKVGTLTLGNLSGAANKGGTGPVVDYQIRSIAVVNGQIIVPASSSPPGVGFAGSLFHVDPVTGNRTLVFGQALVDNSPAAATATAAVIPGWAKNPLDAPVGLVTLDGSRVAMINQFASTAAPYRIMTFDAATGLLGSPVKTLSSQLVASPDFLSSGLAFFQPADLNGDGLSDACQISNGLTSDRNGDGVPDEVQWTCIGDYNLDGFVEFTDFDAFVEDFEAGRTTADVSRDQFLDFGDFDAFVGVFEAGC